MRRPNLCGNSIGVADETYRPTNSVATKEEGRLSLVRRVLGGSKKKDGHTSYSKTKQFGIPITDLQLNNNNVPKVVYRICTFIETNGLKTEGLFKLNAGNPGVIENLKCQLNSNVDADLESCSDMFSIGLLLIIWLKELPQPLLSDQIVSDLVSLMHKYDGDSWWGPVCHETLQTAGPASANAMDSIVHLLHAYTNKHPNSMTYVPKVFAPLFTSEENVDIPSVETVELVTKIIKDYNTIFIKKNIEVDCVSHKQLSIVISDSRSSIRQKKKKDKPETCLKIDRTFVRSNSEERPAVNNGSANGNLRGDSMRRVSSHEDFSKTHPPGKDAPLLLKKATQPLHERNSCSPQRHLPNDEHTNVVNPNVGYASDLFDENEHERRRDSERFAPQHGAPRRNGGRRHHNKHHRSSSRAKENAVYKHTIIRQDPAESGKASSDQKPPASPPKVVASPPDPPAGSKSAPEGPPIGEERSPSPISGVGSPTLDLNTLYYGQITDEEDPIPSFQWNSPMPACDERMVSPRSSLLVTRRMYTAVHSSFDEDSSVLDLATQINNLKRKLKKYDMGFEREFGYKPSHADKMANPDTKKMCISLNKLKKQLKSTKEKRFNAANESKGLKLEIIQEIEQRLSEKRAASGRGEVLEVMGHDQLIDEKAAMQKSLLQLEASFGRPSSREERDMVRGLYDRYRLVKRMLLRHAPSKVKESITELGTILEHEAMEFAPSPPPSPSNKRDPPAQAHHSPAHDALGSSSEQPERKTPEFVLDNLHSRSREELADMQRAAREEKRRLRKCLKDHELEFQAMTGRKLQKEDRNPADSTYAEYKQAKAKLKLIDALLMKHK
ncbi:Family with sequence similarity 13, member A [Nesidiocoris tenuis]|uniref:Family with sequence similarity 13, member A n=1 Tax=Nesidiocoris tenuis TaxID=355587 RepID=A0ABN7BBS9_9HEMI|nr:Family with sequence similarity 13, member A [Nesidiocoris tenuis]